jgi:hypothetical protein
LANTSKPGPKISIDALEFAVSLRMRHTPWRTIAKRVGVGLATLMRWKDLPEWEEARTRIMASLPDNLLYLARQYYVAALRQALAQAEQGRKVDLALAPLARDILEWLDDRIARRAPGDAGGGPSARAQVVILPAQTRGLESRPLTEVLLGTSSLGPPAIASASPARTPSEPPAVRNRAARDPRAEARRRALAARPPEEPVDL